MRTLPDDTLIARCCGKGALLFAALSYASAPLHALAAPVTHTATIEAMQFSPQVLEVKAGDTIEWINKDLFPHDAVSNTPQLKPKFMPSGGRWKFVARNKGSFRYACTLNPMMKASIIVK